VLVPLAPRVPAYSLAGSGPLLIYIAGLDGSGQLFFKQITELTQRYRVVTFTLREDRRFSYDDLADDVAAIIDDIGDPRATIVGESFGGTVSLWFALRHSDKVERLVIVNSFPRFRGEARIRAAIWLARLLPFPLIWPWRLASNALGLHLDGVASPDRRRAHEIMHAVKREGYIRRLELIAGLDIRDRIRKIEAPTMFIAGDKDLLIPSAKEAYSMAATMPNATVRVIKGAGHACLLGDRISLARVIEGWEQELAPG
jgi:pimeloyl-ACP methyl ester carboxylesterase